MSSNNLVCALIGAALVLECSPAALAADTDALQKLLDAQVGMVAGFQIVNPYLAIDVTTAPDISRGTPETEIPFARQWGESFCDRASELMWDETWTLVVYAYGQAKQSFSCRFPNPDHLRPP